MPHVLIVGSGGDLHTKLRALDPAIRTSVICRASTLEYVPGVGDNRVVVVLNEATPVDAWVRAALAVQAETPVDRVASLSEIDQDKAAAISTALGLPGHSPQTVTWVNDKLAMRRRLSECGVDDLPCRQVGSAAELADFVREVGAPVIVKPTSGRASVGVAVVHGPADVERAFAVTHGASAPRLDPSPPLAERYVDGPEYSVEALTVAGEHVVLAVTEKFKDPDTKVELGHLIPARLDPAVERAVVAHTRRVLDALGVAFGPTHTEVIVGSTGPVTVETHLRYAGDQIPDLVRLATGVDLAAAWVRQAVGQDLAGDPRLQDRPRYEQAAAVRFVATKRRGRLLRVDGWDGVAARPGVRDPRQLLPAGAVVEGLASSYSRLASALTTGPDPDTAWRRAEEAVAGVRAVVEAET